MNNIHVINFIFIKYFNSELDTKIDCAKETLLNNAGET